MRKHSKPGDRGVRNRGRRSAEATAAKVEEDAVLNCFFGWRLGGGRKGELRKVYHSGALPSLLPSGSAYATALPQLNDLHFLHWLLAEPETLILHWATQGRRQSETEAEAAERRARRKASRELAGEASKAKALETRR